jgi:hypothetical protein
VSDEPKELPQVPGMHRSADAAYYRAKKPLRLDGLRDGRSNSPHRVSYRHDANNPARASGAVYYRELSSQDAFAGASIMVDPNQPTQPGSQVLTMPLDLTKTPTQVAEAIAAAFSKGSSAVVVTVPFAQQATVNALLDWQVESKKMTKAQRKQIQLRTLKVAASTEIPAVVAPPVEDNQPVVHELIPPAEDTKPIVVELIPPVEDTKPIVSELIPPTEDTPVVMEDEKPTDADIEQVFGHNDSDD